MIIEKQIENMEKSDSKPVEAMHALKKHAFSMKEAFLKREIKKIWMAHSPFCKRIL